MPTKAEYNRQYYLANREKLIQQAYEFRQKHKERYKATDAARYARKKTKILEQVHARYREHREEICKKNRERQDHKKPHVKAYQKQWQAKNKDRIRANSKAYAAKHKRRLCDQARIRNKKRRQIDPVYRMVINLRRRCHLAFTGKSKPATTAKLLGCDFAAFKQHIEALWEPGMSWKNYGFRGWHVDHKIPLADAAGDLDQLTKLLHYTNTQPMWCLKNWRKNKY